jgi:zinc protease
MKRWYVKCTLMMGLLLLAVTSNAQYQVAFKEIKLDNGLTVIMHQDNKTPIVAVSVTYHVGAKNSSADRTGFAHFFEHLLFEGTANIGRGEYFKKLDEIGGAVNAYTSYDITNYYQVVPSNHLETMLYMESERMLHTKIDEIGVSTQRSVIKEEKLQTQDNVPYGTILKEMLSRSFQKHPYQFTVLGEPEHLDAATLEEFMEFYKTYYVPNNAILSIAGDIDYATTEALVKKYFGEIKPGTHQIVRPSIKEPTRNGEIRATIYDNVQLPAVIQAFNLPEMSHPDIPAIEMLSTYLSGGKSSPIYKELIDRTQLAAGAQTIPLLLEDGGVFAILALSNIGISIDTLENALNHQIELLKKNGINDEDFTKLQTIMESNYYNNLGSVQAIGENLATSKINYGDANAFNQKLTNYNKVTKDDIKRVAQKYLGNANKVVLHYLPKSMEPKS